MTARVCSGHIHKDPLAGEDDAAMHDDVGCATDFRRTMLKDNVLKWLATETGDTIAQMFITMVDRLTSHGPLPTAYALSSGEVVVTADIREDRSRTSGPAIETVCCMER